MAGVILGALAIGLSLGMLGSGGSILTVPVLTYLVGQPEKLAIAGSLVIVGGISLIGALPYAFRREVDWRSVVWFGLPGMLGAWLGAAAAQALSGVVQLLIFAAIMLLAAWRMIAGARAGAAPEQGQPGPARSAPRMVRTGIAVGLVTGVVGVGGGFLIVPSLVLLVGLTMRRAVATSLVVISTNAFTGFVKHAAALKSLHLALDWHVVATFIVLGGTGTVVGNALGARLPQQRLRQAFGVLLVLMSGFIAAREGPRLF
jgi:hypothetical protein